MPLKTSWSESNLPNYKLMNGYKCIDVRNDILHAHIIATCLRQYLFAIGVGPTEMFLAVSCCVAWY